MENNQNSKFSFKEAVVNAELGEKLARFKILADFLSSALVCCYQSAYSGKSLTQQECEIIRHKYEEVKDIVDDTLRLLEASLPEDKKEGATIDVSA
jgi:hypothetical protein